MKHSILIFLLVLSLSGLWASVELISSSPRELVFEYEPGEYELVEAGDFFYISAPGMNSDGIIGAPSIPYSELKVAIPPGGEISVSLLSEDYQSLPLLKPIQPVPNVVDQYGVWINNYVKNPELYTSFSHNVFELLPNGSFRGYSFVPIRINPFRYDGNTGLRVATNLRFKVTISGNTDYRSPAQTEPLAETLLSLILNPEQALFWRQDTRTTVNYADFSKSDWWIRIETDKDGMYRINRSQISSFPLADLDPRSLRLFTTGGAVLGNNAVQLGPEFREVPITVVGEDDGLFNTSDHILFYGTSRNGLSKNASIGDNHFFSPYSQNTVYWLTFGGDFPGNPQRIQAQTAYDSYDVETNTFTEIYRNEEDRYRRDVHSYRWFMSRFFGNTTADYAYSFTLPDLDISQDQILRFEIIQESVESYVTHRISVNVNGTQLQSDSATNPNVFTWPNVSNYGFERTINSLIPGENAVTLRLLRSGTLNYYLDYFQISYSRFINKTAGQFRILTSDSLRRVRYNITGDNTNLDAYMVNNQYSVEKVPVQEGYLIAQGITGARIQLLQSSEYYSPVLVEAIEPVNLLADPTPLDNLIIAPQEFVAAAQNLAAIYREDYGLNTRIVDQQDIFNQFNGGHPDPAALRQFIRHVYHNFPTSGQNARLSSLTLLGLGTIDWVNTSRQAAPKNKLMVWQRSINQASTLSDDWFGMITQDNFPELAIGRYPVKNVSELNTMIANFRDYTRNIIPGWWRNSAVLLADDLYNGPNTFYEDKHTKQVQQAASLMVPSIYADKIFAWNYSYDEFQNKPAARDRLVSSINDGKLVWIYIGHGSYDNLGTEDYFNLSTDMGRLANGKKMPLFIAMSCSVSNFDYWGFESLGEKLVLRPENGAIASWSASRISFPEQNAALLYLLIPRMINQNYYLGQAIMSAKIAYSADPYNESVYMLLGDPHLKINPPLTYAGINPVLPEAEDVFNSREVVEFSGSFLASQPVNGTAELVAFDTENQYRLDNVSVSEKGQQIFRGSVSVENNQFTGAYIVPDDVRTGNTASIVSYIWDPTQKQDFVSYYSSMKLSDEAVPVTNVSAPQIELFLSSWDFRAGDTVGEAPILMARISDDSGINITGNAGRNILLVIDGSLQPIPVTQYFNYDTNSYTTGTLQYQLPPLTEGSHNIQLIAFDSFNLPAVASTEFVVRKIGDFNLERFLIYPNPMQNQSSFTFLLSDNADLEIGIYTIRGRKIRELKTLGRQGFNTIPWDGRDEAGNRLANNTYFVKIKATNSAGERVEKTESVVVYN